MGNICLFYGFFKHKLTLGVDQQYKKSIYEFLNQDMQFTKMSVFPIKTHFVKVHNFDINYNSSV